MALPVLINVGFSIGSYFLCKKLIPGLSGMFLDGNLFGNDLGKKTKPKVPESMGLVTGGVFMVLLFLFIPFGYGNAILNNETFRHDEFVEFIAALLSICCMVLLGFADDVLNLRWRHKMLLPTIASLPLLMVYWVNFNSTTIILPNFVHGMLGSSLNIGLFYYVFMASLAVFCTNAINILAGINGLEVGQSLVIALSIMIFNLIEICTDSVNKSHHMFSLYFMVPYFATSLALWQYNKYPAQVFVGDTFCYLSGMTFAVVGILGHFSKTVLLFFIPQIINFLYSVPQLFHFVGCPRHRLPKHNPITDRLEPSLNKFRYSELNVLGKLFVTVFKFLHIMKWEEKDDVIITNNFTIINLAIIVFGPMHERKLTYVLLTFQVLCTLIAFIIRYPMAAYFYEYRGK